MEQEILYSHDPITTEAERIQSILDRKYAPADLEKEVQKCDTIDFNQQEQLLKLLRKYEHLFDGSLGTWKTDPIELELKDPSAKPCHAKPYPVPRSQEKKLKEEVERLCKFGVLRKINRSEWACPMFLHPKARWQLEVPS